jgi:alpha-glucosidase
MTCVALTGCLAIAVSSVAAADLPMTVGSPDGKVKLHVALDDREQLGFKATFHEYEVASGKLGLKFAANGPLATGLKLREARERTTDVTYSIPVGKSSSARDQHRELALSLDETRVPGRRLDVLFRVFNDGIAFRYVIPKQPAIDEFRLVDELTEFSLTADPQARLLPLKNYTTPYEAYYDDQPLSKTSPSQLIGLPLLLRESEKTWLAITEANLKDWSGLYLSRSSTAANVLTAKLSPLPGQNDGTKVVGRAPHASPWRILMLADDPGRLIESNIVFHLSDPCAIQDTSWIRPGKTTFPWWNHYVLDGVNFEPGVNTATMKYYIDFCAEQGIPYHSLDGLDIAWYGGPIHPNGPTDVTRAAPSINLPELLSYAKQKGVRLRLWMHWKALKQQIDQAFGAYEEWGIEGVMVDFMDRDDQEMVAFYHEMASKAAKHHLTLTLHGAYKPTGMERTWPNVLSYEAVLNQEYNKWQPAGVRGTPPDHNLDVAFVRMLSGPLDYHQGGMRNVLPDRYQFRDIAPPVQGTRGHQLAMYVVYQNHLPMLADSPTAYRGQPGFDFLVDVPCNWDETRVLHAEPGRCIVVARRRGKEWYLGGMTGNSTSRELQIPLQFLSAQPHSAVLIVDDPSSGPSSINNRRDHLTNEGMLRVSIPPSGGFAGKISPGR